AEAGSRAASQNRRAGSDDGGRRRRHWSWGVGTSRHRGEHHDAVHAVNPLQSDGRRRRFPLVLTMVELEKKYVKGKQRKLERLDSIGRRYDRNPLLGVFGARARSGNNPDRSVWSVQ